MSSKQVLFINGWKVPKLMQYEVAYNKLYADDTGRDLDGNNRATLIGIFPKLQVKAELKISWYDPEIKTLRNGISYYINDFNV